MLEMKVAENIEVIRAKLLEILGVSQNLDIDAVAVNLGLVDYSELFPVQAEIAAIKKRNPNYKDLILFMEHLPTINFGRKPEKNSFFDSSLNPYANYEEVRNRLSKDYGIGFTLSNRPGGSTYLGPGQLIVHPIVSCSRVGIRNAPLGQNKLDLIMKDIAARFGVEGVSVKDHRDDSDKRDVYLSPEHCSNAGRLGAKLGSKVAAFTGLDFKTDIMYNGFTLFINKKALRGFDLIPACGYPKEVLTVVSIQDVLEERDIRYGEIPITEARLIALKSIGVLCGYVERIFPYDRLEALKYAR